LTDLAPILKAICAVLPSARQVAVVEVAGQVRAVTLAVDGAFIIVRSTED
jgi:hypothetical protein